MVSLLMGLGGSGAAVMMHSFRSGMILESIPWSGAGATCTTWWEDQQGTMLLIPELWLVNWCHCCWMTLEEVYSVRTYLDSNSVVGLCSGQNIIYHIRSTSILQVIYSISHARLRGRLLMNRTSPYLNHMIWCLNHMIWTLESHDLMLESHDLNTWITWSEHLNHMIWCLNHTIWTLESHDPNTWITWSEHLNHMIWTLESHELATTFHELIDGIQHTLACNEEFDHSTSSMSGMSLWSASTITTWTL